MTLYDPPMLDPFNLADLLSKTDSPPPFDRVERFIELVLAPHGIGTDGVMACRTIDQSEMRLCVAGSVYWIDQSLHVFAIEVRLDEAGAERLVWTLYVDPVLHSARAERHAVDLMNDPSDYEWERVCSGYATLDANGALTDVVASPD